MAFFDFDQIKQSISLTQAAELLGLELAKSGTNQVRGVCPACKGSAPRSLVITDPKGAYCFSAGKGGDVIWLTSHILECPAKDAAAWLSERMNNVRGASTVPSTVPTTGGEKTLEPLPYLEHDHPAVIAVGFEPEEAKQLGIGYCPKGILRGHVAIPVYLPDGRLTGYVGITEAKLPPSWHHIASNVVPFGKKSA